MNKADIIKRIEEIHGSDNEQLDFILGDEKRLIVTATAGCGKTMSMISKIAYEMVTNDQMNFKKILALTFSINAAAKIREDTQNILPHILGKEPDVTKKLSVSNYHNFSMRLIRKHGYVINENLAVIDTFIIVPENSRDIMKKLTNSEQSVLLSYDNYLKEINIGKLKEIEKDYFSILKEKLIPHKIMTFNGLLLLAIKLLEQQSLRNFYQKYFCMVIVDEFQDTNYLSYRLIRSLIGENKIILMGDDIQKIYGFLGAIPNLFSHMAAEYKMKEMEFKTNHRFKDNQRMAELDSYLRGLFKNYENVELYEEKALVNFKLFKTTSAEAKFIVNQILQQSAEGKKAAVLVRAGFAADHVINELESRGVAYFNGLFSDQNPEYVRFHEITLSLFVEESGPGRAVSQKVLNKVLFRLEENRASIITDPAYMFIFESLYRLLDTLFRSLKYTSLTKAGKYNKVLFILANGSLKHLLNEMDELITLTTIHGSKGLEWDYVYLPELTSYIFPSSRSICSECARNGGNTLYEKTCEFNFSPQLKSQFEEELSLFYVAVTRARRNIYLFANRDRNRFGHAKRASCLVRLPNLKLKTDFEKSISAKK
ncbi:ATP-dependent helicase [Bacillus sp. CMF12]|uniref:UvrD-helicase domain-containing protein n=1 Tax=Bacillus sp. CMF12 TaxID=2884834 RepID=UPI0020798412|nr:ATP-dependent helicase [Bacillus sp. CMF12]USK48020.1 ATP-dependent helicase [Bacillus sp. CMF12]